MLDKNENQRNLEGDLNGLYLPHNNVVALDFDEMVVGSSDGRGVHLTARVMDAVSEALTEEDQARLNELGHCSFEGIQLLQSMAYGLNYEQFLFVCDAYAKNTPWRGGFDEFIKKISSLYSIIFISSGVRDICYAKLKEIGFPRSNILSADFKVDNGVISENRLIVSDVSKGEIITSLRQKGKKVVAVGHSKGDLHMLESADLSVSYREDYEGLSEIKVQTVDELERVIADFFINK